MNWRLLISWFVQWYYLANHLSIFTRGITLKKVIMAQDSVNYILKYDRWYKIDYKQYIPMVAQETVYHVNHVK